MNEPQADWRYGGGQGDPRYALVRHGKVEIWVLIHEGSFRDAFASYSAAMREKHVGTCCVLLGPVVREIY